VIDTFQVDSLPESYRQTFSAGGDWVEAVSRVFLRSADPMEQFDRLSTLLESIKATIVFIVEDLDRNDTRTFEVQEVLAFLERLKAFPNLTFVLTGGLASSQRIDYPKLCDHIEYLRTVQPQQASALLLRLLKQCDDTTVFRHVSLGESGSHHRWNLLSATMMQDYEEWPLPHAVAVLLNTPRSLRLALGRTFTAWQTLHGEIDVDHLLAVNVLRFGAPECFQFLVRRWDRLRSSPTKHSSFGPDREEYIRQAVVDDWNKTVAKVEWSPAAALQVMEFILPATTYWLVDKSRAHQQFSTNGQGVSQERYWTRAVSESIDQGDICDQEVIRDTKAWLDDPHSATTLIRQLTSSLRYSEVWEDLAGHFFADQRKSILHLCEQVLRCILREHGASASDDSQGFANTWRFAGRRISLSSDNRTWLQDRISEASAVSIEMVNSLWHFYGSPGRYSLLQMEDCESVRQHVLKTMKETIVDVESLIIRLTSKSSLTLYQLVFDPGTCAGRALVDVQSWSWLGPLILEALRMRNTVVAANSGVLLGARASDRERMPIDTEVLNEFFGEAANEVINILDETIDQIAESDQTLIRNVVRAAREKFQIDKASSDERSSNSSYEAK